MNYAAVVFVGFMAISAVWYAVYARKRKSLHRFLQFPVKNLFFGVDANERTDYKGPPESDAL
jgi:hypothetical protein